MWQYFKKYFFIYLKLLNRKLLKTYPLIEDCARCRDCGRNVHDFYVPDELWAKVIGSGGVWCYDCFCDRADRKLGVGWRLELVERYEKWHCHQIIDKEN